MQEIMQFFSTHFKLLYSTCTWSKEKKTLFYTLTKLEDELVFSSLKKFQYILPKTYPFE